MRILAASLAFGLVISPLAAEAEFPEKPITLIVPYGAGGGTDVTARFLADGLSEELGVPVNVVNRTGGGGLVGHTDIVQADADGYTIGVATSAIGKFHWIGQSEITYQDTTPLILYNLDPATLVVRSDDEIETLEDALSFMQETDSFLIGGVKLGSFHMALVDLMLQQEIDPARAVVIPTGGAAPSLAELASGGVRMVPSTLPEARGLIDAGNLRPLAVWASERDPIFPDVPTIGEVTGTDIISGPWRGVIAPAGLPDEVSETYIEALEAVWNSEGFRTSMTGAGFGLVYEGSEGFTDFLRRNDELHGEAVERLGAE